MKIGKHVSILDQWIPLISFTLAMAVIFFLSQVYNYLLFHSLVEFFSIVVACGIFMIVWNIKRVVKDTFLLFLGIAYLFVAILDLLHTLTFSGMGVFEDFGINVPTQVWIAARYTESLSLLIAPCLIKKRVKANTLFLFFAIPITVTVAMIYHWRVFPRCYLDGVGFTAFNMLSEYFISIFCSIAIVLLYRKRQYFDKIVLRWIVASVAMTIASELSVSLFGDISEFSNFVAHYYKFLSFFFLYKAIIESGLMRPFSLLFRDLKQREQALQEAHEGLERKVALRTKELRKANRELKLEISERKRTEEALTESEAKYRSLANNIPNSSVYVFDENHRFLMVEGSAIYGKNNRKKQLEGKRVREVFNSKICELWEPQMSDAIQGKATSGEYKSGGNTYLLQTAPLKDESGSIHAGIALSLDITQRKKMEEELLKSKIRLANVQRIVHLGTWDYDLETDELYWSDELYRICGIAEISAPPRDLLFVHPDDRDFVRNMLDRQWSKDSSGDIEFRIVRPDGVQRFIRVQGEVICDKKGEPIKIFGTAHDITEQREAADNLLRHDAILQAVSFAAERFLMVDEINDTIPIVLEQLGGASKVSRVHLFENHIDAAGDLCMSQRFEWATEDIRYEAGLPMLQNISYEKSGLGRWIELMCKGRVVVGHTRTFPLTEQKSLAARAVKSILVVPIPVGADWWGYIAFDVCRGEREWSVAEIDAFKTAADTIGAAIMRRRAEEKVQASLKEKELLLQEIHHRVKNNLQIISSLLDMSCMRITDIQAVHFFEDARDKIHSMALIHSQLYRSDRFDRIDMRDHIQELLNYLSYIYDKRGNITPIVRAEDVHLSINQAIPCTLILNELISNAYKHAFKDEQKGSIEISMKVIDNLFILSIRDNGDGFPADMDVYKTDSLGLKLVRNLVQKQLRGQVEIRQTDFTEFVIRFGIIQEEERYAQDTRR